MSSHRSEAIHEMAAALERADASARVLGARARAARDGAGPAAAFSALAIAGPDGLVPAVGTGGTLAARHLEQAALAAAAAGPVLPDDVIDALGHAAAEARGQSGGARALDPRGVAVAVRREVAAVRGLAAHSMPRDDLWEVMRLGTFLPRAAWMSALLLACATVALDEPDSASSVWHAAALVAGTPALAETAPDRVLPALVTDLALPVSVSHAVAEITSALFALSRRGRVEPGPLALARATGARLGAPGMPALLSADPVGAISEALDAIGALAGALRPRPADARGPRGMAA
jgi:uncharacterized alpha-E superfamily protein